MKQQSGGLSAKQILIAAICMLAAVSLLIIALMEPKQPQEGKWIALNDEVEKALVAMDNVDEKATGKLDDGKGSKEAKEEKDAMDSEEVGEGRVKNSNAGSVSKLEGQEAIGAATEDAEVVKEDAGVKEESGTSENEKLDVNRATVAELDQLKGIGPAKAQAIVADREKNGYFESIDELLRVKGIGNKLLAGIEENIVVRP